MSKSEQGFPSKDNQPKFAKKAMRPLKLWTDNLAWAVSISRSIDYFPHPGYKPEIEIARHKSNLYQAFKIAQLAETQTCDVAFEMDAEKNVQIIKLLFHNGDCYQLNLLNVANAEEVAGLLTDERDTNNEVIDRQQRTKQNQNQTRVLNPIKRIKSGWAWSQALHYDSKDDHVTAKTYLDKVEALTPRKDPEFLVFKCWVLFKINEYEEAREVAEYAITQADKSRRYSKYDKVYLQACAQDVLFRTKRNDPDLNFKENTYRQSKLFDKTRVKKHILDNYPLG